MSQVLERRASTQQYTISPLGGALGAEVIGLDLAQPVSAELIRQMKEALNQYGVLCFREQNLTEPQQIAFSTLWGPLEDFPEENKTVAAATVYHVANVSAQGEHLPETDHRVIFQKVNALWHTDSSYRYIPAYASLLYGIEVMPAGAEGGRTGFSSMVAAYEALSDEMKATLKTAVAAIAGEPELQATLKQLNLGYVYADDAGFKSVMARDNQVFKDLVGKLKITP